MHYSDSENKSGTLDIDCLLWAIGRSPEVEDLGLDRAGVKQNERGQIIADDYQNTSVDGIYSLGDVCGKIELTPVAIAAGRQLANRLFGGPDFKNAKLDYTNIPSVVFAHPEVGSIGMTEPQAREKYGDKVKVYNTSFTAMYYAMMEADEKAPTSYKLVCVGAEEKVVRTSQPIIPLFKPVGSPETLSRNSRAPPKSINLTWRTITGRAPYTRCGVL